MDIALYQENPDAAGLVASDLASENELTKLDRHSRKHRTNKHRKRTPLGSIQPPANYETIGSSKFSTLNMLGRGAFGVVEKVTDKRTGQTYARKKVKIDSSETMNELKVMQGLDHKNIVKLLDFYQGRGQLVLMMEYCEGGALRELAPIRDEATVARYIDGILDALDYLHSRGIIHRDVKAANVMLTADGVVKLGDFGVSLDASESSTLKRSEPNGSVYWMAPEIVKMEQARPACDIWSLGATVVELLTGKPPNGDMVPESAVLALQRGEPFSYPPGISRECTEFLDLCFTRNPAERPSAAVLRRSRWIKVEKMGEFMEVDGDDDDDYGSDFEEKTTSSPSKSQLLQGFNEEGEEFADGFDTVDEVQEYSVVDLIFDLESGAGVDTLMRGLRMFKKNPAAVDEFSSNGCIPLVIDMYEQAPELVRSFAWMVTKSHFAVQNFVSSGGYRFISKLLFQQDRQDQLLAIELLDRVLFHEKTRRDQWAALMLAAGVPQRLATLTRQMPPHSARSAIQSIELIYDYASPSYRVRLEPVLTSLNLRRP